MTEVVPTLLRQADHSCRLLELFRQDYGAGGHVRGAGGVRVMAVPNPLAVLQSLLAIPTNGDAVYSQEELDRVISQLIDQSINNAPPPAPEDAIQTLPKQKVDEEMLGPEGKAECSICMEPVQIGTEVAVLPCKHWFHFLCIEAWLKQHNTCPHCRRGIGAAGQYVSAFCLQVQAKINANYRQDTCRRVS